MDTRHSWRFAVCCAADARPKKARELHGQEDMLKEARFLNISKKTIVGVRMGYTIKALNLIAERKLGDWNNLASAVEPDFYGELTAQRLDTAPMRSVGTLVLIYVADVAFQDGSVWHNDEAISDHEPRSMLALPSMDTITAPGDR